MKKALFLFMIFGFSITYSSYGQGDTIIKNGVVSLATLVVDYTTNNFEGGNIAYYSCSDCENDSIPFDINYHEPADFGDVTFKLSSLKDSVFYGSIVWFGRGKIKYPATFSNQSPFINTSVTIEKPDDIKYISVDSFQTKFLNLLSKVDTAWHAIESLEITSLFRTKGFKSAIFFYAPTVGGIDRRVAKWIIFLYHNDQINAAKNPKIPVLISPNPTDGEVIITLNTANQEKTSYNIFNQSGQLVAEGDFHGCSHKLNMSILSPGLYYLKLTDKDQKTIATEKIMLE